MGKSLRGSSSNYKAKIRRQVRNMRKGKAGGKWKKTRASNSRNTTHRSKKKERQYQTRMKNLAKAEVARKEKEEAEKLAGKGMVE